MAISSAGLGSNLDVNGIISQLMALEQAPLTALAKKEAALQAKISALGSLKGALSAVQTAASALIPPAGTTALQKFSVFRTAVADTAIASASASSTAIAGTYSLEVTALAQAQRLVSQQSGAYTSSTSPLASQGTLRLASGSTATGSFVETSAKDIDFTAAGKTLGDLRDAINSANLGVSATIITTTNAGVSRAQLILSGNTPGQSNVFKLSGLDGFNFDPDAPAVAAGTMSQEAADGGQAAQNASFKLNGIATTSTSNTVTGVIDGVTLNLTKQSAAGVATTLTVTRDTSSVASGVTAFVKAYNDFNTVASNASSYNAVTKTAGALNGDSTLRSAQAALRSIIGNVPTGLADATLKRLSDIGVSLQKDGALAVDSAKLTTAISADLSGVAELLSAYGTAFKSATDGLVGATGTIVSRSEGLAASIKSIGKQGDAVVARLTQIERRYRKQFTALDTLMSSMTKTSNFLSQQLANLPK